MSGGKVTHQEVKQFFIENWAPAIVKVHQPGGENFSSIILYITNGMKGMATQQVMMHSQQFK